MKTNEAPEKIYLIRNFSNPTALNTTDDHHGGFLYEWYKSREKDADVEYIRADVFIEKVCERLEPILKNYAGYYVGNDILKNFKNDMMKEIYEYNR